MFNRDWKPYTLLKIVGYSMVSGGGGYCEEYYYVIAADDNSEVPERRQAREEQIKQYKGRSLKKQKFLDALLAAISVAALLAITVVYIGVKGGAFS